MDTKILKDYRKLAGVAIVFLALIISFVIAEIFLRYMGYGIYSPHRIQHITSKPADSLIFNPHFGIMMSPGSKYKADLLGLNNQSWRDLNFSNSIPLNTCRIAFIGDSFVQGRETSLFGSFPKICQAIMNSSILEKKIQVLQFGKAGFNLINYQFVLLEECLALHPEYVVVSVFPFNDIKDMSTNVNFSQSIPDYRPSYVLDMKNYFEEFQRNALINISDISRKEETSRESLLNNLRKSSRFLNLLVKFYYRLRRRLIEKSAMKYISNFTILEKGFKIYLEPEPEDINKAYKQIEKILSVMKEKADSCNIELILLVLPCADQIDKHLARMEEKAFKQHFGEKYIFSSIDYKKPNKKLHNICVRRVITYWSPLEEFRQYHEEFPNQPLYTRARSPMWWGHFTSTGNELMGYYLSQKLMKLID